MARLTSRPRIDPDGTDGRGPHAEGATAPTEARADSADGATRVRLARPSRLGAEPDLTVAVLAQRQALVDGRAVDAVVRDLGGGRHVLEAGGTRTPVVLEPPRRSSPGGPVTREVLVAGFRFEVEVEPERRAALRDRAVRGRAGMGGAEPLEVRAVIPGRVVAVSVAAGDRVTIGQQLLVIEAMKMRNELRAPRDGTIDRVAVAEGVKIEIGDLLVVVS
jgi:glutaconyl-CoA/methylmalonyl-CoA decarboxylase subunit gamma